MVTAAQVPGVVLCCVATLLAGCGTRSVDVRPLSADAAEFRNWDCLRIDEERDRVQRRAADVAYAVDQRVGNNILALGVGLTVFWPALLALRPEGLEAADLARLKGRFEALNRVAQEKTCPDLGDQLPAWRAAELPVGPGDRLVYEDRAHPRQPAVASTLRLTAVRRGEIEYRLDAADGAPWLHDLAGNVLVAPPGALRWPHLLRGELALGHVIGGDLLISGDPLARARMRGQVVAVGTHTVGERRFEVAVIELFGDATLGEAFTRVEGALVVDRSSGVLLRVELRSAQPRFALQRRLVRVEPGPP